MTRAVLEVKSLTKHYNSKNKMTEALKGVSIDVYAGEVVALLGANGAGKTTLSSILATLYPPTSGDVLYKGQSIYSNLMLYRRQIGYCPQRSNLNGLLTLENNLLFAGRFYGVPEHELQRTLKELSEQLGLTEYIHDKPSALSGGWRQRFMLARALMHRPSFLILDEPTVALDPHVRRQLWDKIMDLKKSGLSVILTTHYLDEAEVLADRVCILDRGSIKMIDRPENLKSNFHLPTLEAVFLQLMHEEVAA